MFRNYLKNGEEFINNTNWKIAHAMRLKNRLKFLSLTRGSILWWNFYWSIQNLTIATFSLIKTTVSVDF